ncbi:hypothetical protein WBJ53_25725 [Spirosoma sp. SC4-14]|uniref:hypothetical protein n=1 Tax=Spirosoma sp. SC4-14 TaxID=3128900 RepID=UPI0030D5E1ED
MLLLLISIGLPGKCQFANNKIDSTHFAKIYIYRPFTLSAVLLGFGIRKEGEKLFKLRNNSARELRIYKSAPIILSAKSVERISKITLNVEVGKSYYIRCIPRISYLTVNPKLELVNEAKGKQEYEAIVDEN